MSLELSDDDDFAEGSENEEINAEAFEAGGADAVSSPPISIEENSPLLSFQKSGSSKSNSSPGHSHRVVPGTR